MRAVLVSIALLSIPVAAAPKLKPQYPDVAVGREFEAPWPPVEVAPPNYRCRIERVGSDGVDVRILNVPNDGEYRLWVSDRCFHVPLGAEYPRPTREQVQQLIIRGPHR